MMPVFVSDMALGPEFFCPCHIRVVLDGSDMETVVLEGFIY